MGGRHRLLYHRGCIILRSRIGIIDSNCIRHFKRIEDIYFIPWNSNDGGLIRHTRLPAPASGTDGYRGRARRQYRGSAALRYHCCNSNRSFGRTFIYETGEKIVPQSFEKMGSIASLGEQKTFKLEETPGFGISVFTAMLPVIIMSISTVITLIQETMGLADNSLLAAVRLIGNASTSMVISLLVAIYTMGMARKIPIKQVMDSCSTAITQIGMMLLIIGGGGAFKQVLINGGVGDYVAELFKGTAMSPILLAWVIAAILRISLGSATVAALSTTGLVLPMLGQSDVNLALVVLATGAGSVIASHVNDAGFWMFKEYFGLSMKETFATWTLLETIIAVAGLGFTLLLSLFV